MKRILTVTAALLLAATAARAESLLDKAAPVPKAKTWVRGETPPKWKSLKGRAALVELLDPDDLVSLGLHSRTGEISQRTKDRKLLIVSLAVGTGGDKGTAQAFAAEQGGDWAFGCDDTGSVWVDFGSPSLPCYFLVAPDGRVLWQGSPATLDDAKLDRFLEWCRLWRKDEVAKPVRKAAGLYASGKYGAASREAAKAVAAVRKRKEADLPVDGGEEKDAAVVVDAVKAVAEIRLAIAKKLEKDRWSLDALEIYEAIEARFGGTDWKKAAEERISAMKLDKRAMKEVEAGKRLRKILKGTKPLTPRNVEKAIEALDTMISYYEGLVTADRAKAHARRLRKLLSRRRK
ncbi:MAG: thioredoxin domain-containing protein [Planctomycetota bacterium]